MGPNNEPTDEPLEEEFPEAPLEVIADSPELKSNDDDNSTSESDVVLEDSSEDKLEE